MQIPVGHVYQELQSSGSNFTWACTGCSLFADTVPIPTLIDWFYFLSRQIDSNSPPSCVWARVLQDHIAAHLSASAASGNRALCHNICNMRCNKCEVGACPRRNDDAHSPCNNTYRSSCGMTSGPTTSPPLSLPPSLLPPTSPPPPQAVLQNCSNSARGTISFRQTGEQHLHCLLTVPVHLCHILHPQEKCLMWQCPPPMQDLYLGHPTPQSTSVSCPHQLVTTDTLDSLQTGQTHYLAQHQSTPSEHLMPVTSAATQFSVQSTSRSSHSQVHRFNTLSRVVSTLLKYLSTPSKKYKVS